MVKEYLRELIDKWKVYRLLKRHGCKTLEQYNILYDPLINRKAFTVSKFYHGYPYTIRIPFSLYTGDWHEGIEQLSRWCQRYCKEKWRHDWHRVDTVFTLGSGIGITDHINCGIGGADVIYFAFVCQKDYNWFILSHNLND